MNGYSPEPIPGGGAGLDRVRGTDERISERACRRIISRHRQRVDWVLHVPEWEPLFAEGLVALDLPQPRRGINLRAVLDSLLLESKFSLVCWVIERSNHRVPSKTALKLCDILGLHLWDAKELDLTLSPVQWDKLQGQVRFSLTTHHRSYKRAQTILFRRYQSLLHKMVNRQVFDANKRPDAYQEASLGLIHAIDKVEDSPASFGSYARTWISRQIKNYLMGEHFPVHVPINLASKILRSQGASGTANDPEAEKLSNLVKPGVSLDQMADNEEHAPSQLSDEDAASPIDALSEKDVYHALHSLLDQLTDKQREVLCLRFGIDSENGMATLSTIASRVGISHQQVSMREKRALQRLECVLKPLYEEIYG